MGAGKQNRRITLQRATVTFDDFGTEVETWEPLATVWAELRDVSAAESFRAQEVGAKISTRFTIRYSSDVADLNPRDRLIHANLVYQIIGVREKMRNRWIEVDTVARPDIAAVVTSP